MAKKSTLSLKRTPLAGMSGAYRMAAANSAKSSNGKSGGGGNGGGSGGGGIR